MPSPSGRIALRRHYELQLPAGLFDYLLNRREQQLDVRREDVADVADAEGIRRG